MKKVGVTFCGKRYEVALDAEFAAFVEDDLKSVGVDFTVDNRPDALLKAYLRMAKQVKHYEDELAKLVERINLDADIT